MPYDSSRDQYHGLAGSSAGAMESATREYAAVLSDTDDLEEYAKGFYVSVAGAVKYLPIKNADDEPVTKTCNVGYHPIQIRRIFTTGTDADLGITTLHG